MEFEVIPPATDDERAVLERTLPHLGDEAPSCEPRVASAWWRTGAEEAVGSGDMTESELYALSPRNTRGATRA